MTEGTATEENKTNGDTQDTIVKDDSKDTTSSKKEHESEESIRERLKQRQEARRRQSQEEHKGDDKNDKETEKKSSPRKRRRRNRHRHRHRDQRRGPPPPEWRGSRGGGGPPPPQHWREQPHPRDWRGRDNNWGMMRGSVPPPHRGGDWGHHGGPPPPRGYHGRSHSRSRSLSTRSRSSRSRSYSYSSGSSRSSYDSDRRSRSRSRSRSYDRRRSRSRSYSSHSSSSSGSSSEDEDSKTKTTPGDALTKDQRTVFVSQLIMRTTDRDISKFFRKKLKLKINEVILLRDKRTNRHKGCAYVELSKLEDVATAIAASGQAPDFQRFPVLIKASEAEKNYTAGSAVSSSGPMVGPDGKLYESQKVYVGNLSPTTSAESLQTVFGQFGQLDKVSLQVDVTTGMPRGFVFLAFKDPKSANLAIQAMSGQVMQGRPLKTGWASNTTSAVPGVEIRTSDEFPQDAAVRIQNAQVALAQLQGTTTAMVSSAVSPSAVAEAAINAALGLAPAAASAVPAVATVPGVPTMAAVPAVAAVPGLPTTAAVPAVATTPTAATTAPAPVTATPEDDAKKIGGTPSRHILVHNMFNKDEETEEGWQEDVRLDFEEECSKHGKMEVVKVMSQEPGGKIYASFTALDGAKTCALNLAGRWFDKRQLRVEFVDQVPE